jgi:hypothetical protein
MENKLKEADENAIREIASALQEGKLAKDQIPYIMSHVVEAIVDQDSFSNKIKLRELYMQLRDMLASVSISSEEKDVSRIFSGMQEVTRDHLDAIQRYDDLVWLATISPEMGEKMEEMTKGKAISTGAVLARAERGVESLDPEFSGVARKCLVNALNSGGAWTVFHASEVLSLHFGIETKGIAVNALEEVLEKGDPRDIVAAEMYLRHYGIETKDKAVERLIGILRGGEAVESAAIALSKFGLDPKELIEEMILKGNKEAISAYLSIYHKSPADIYSLAVMADEKREIKLELGSLSKSDDDRHIAKVAGIAMSYVRNRDELDSAVQDRRFLCDDIIQDPTTPQMMYVECVFDAVEKVLGAGPRTDIEKMEYQAALKQLTTFGADPGAMKGLLDNHTLKLIRRNVENALLHALVASDFRDLACAGLEKIGSDRIEEVLDKIVARIGESSPAGIAASEALENIRGRKIEETIVFVPPKPPKIPSRPQGQRLLQ